MVANMHLTLSHRSRVNTTRGLLLGVYYLRVKCIIKKSIIKKSIIKKSIINKSTTNKKPQQLNNNNRATKYLREIPTTTLPIHTSHYPTTQTLTNTLLNKNPNTANPPITSSSKLCTCALRCKLLHTRFIEIKSRRETPSTQALTYTLVAN